MKGNHRHCHTSACRRILFELESFVLSSASDWSVRSSAEAILSLVQPKVSQWPLLSESKKKLTSWGGIIFIISCRRGGIRKTKSDSRGPTVKEGSPAGECEDATLDIQAGKPDKTPNPPPLHPWSEDVRTKVVTRRRSVAAATTVVPSSAVILLLCQLPDDPLQLLTGLLLVLQELLHPFVLLLPKRTRKMKMENFTWVIASQLVVEKVHWRDRHTHFFQLVDLVL